MAPPPAAAAPRPMPQYMAPARPVQAAPMLPAVRR
jgi:hypothetical protein